MRVLGRENLLKKEREREREREREFIVSISLLSPLQARERERERDSSIRQGEREYSCHHQCIYKVALAHL